MLSRRAFCAGSTLALGGLVAGCRTRTANDGRIPIRLSGYVGNPAETGLLAALIREFNEQQTRIHVAYEPIPGQYYPKLLAMLVSGTAPDVFYLDTTSFRPYLSKKKILLPLNPFLAKGATKEEDFIPELLSAFTDNGTIYGIPKDFNTHGLFYNKEMFDAAGLTYPGDDWDLERLRDVARKLTKPHGPAGLILNLDSVDRFLPIARSYGAELFGPDGNCSLASAEGVAALDFYSGLQLKDRAAIQPGEVGAKYVEEAFGRRMGAMCLLAGWGIAYLEESNPDVKYGIATMPRGPKTASNLLFSVAYSIPQSSKHPEAAWELIEFLTSAAAQSRVTFAIPSRRATSESYVATHPLHRALLDGAKLARPYEFGAKGTRVEACISVAMQQVFIGGRSSHDALADAATEIDRITRL
jgi:multiple sugar transport system substrate-binding protein